MEVTGTCKHGSFILAKGCPQCMGELGFPTAKQIVKVRYFSDTTGEESAREYTYFSELPLKVGDIVLAPVRDTTAKARVTAIDLPEIAIAPFRDKVKTITADAIMSPEKLAELENKVGVPNRSVPNETEAVIRVNPGACLAPTDIVHTGMAVIKVQPESDITILSLLAEANQLRDFATARVIATDDDMKGAVDDLTLIAKIKKALIAKKDEYVKPIKAHEDTIKAMFQTILTPIDDADRINRQKWTAYRAEKERQAREAEAINNLRMEAAQKEMELKGELTEPVNLVEVAPLQPKTIRTEVGSAGMRDNWTYEVVDFIALPNEYKVADAAMLNSIAKKYHDQKQIPGVKFTNKPILAVNAR